MMQGCTFVLVRSPPLFSDFCCYESLLLCVWILKPVALVVDNEYKASIRSGEEQ